MIKKEGFWQRVYKDRYYIMAFILQFTIITAVMYIFITGDPFTENVDFSLNEMGQYIDCAAVSDSALEVYFTGEVALSNTKIESDEDIIPIKITFIDYYTNENGVFVAKAAFNRATKCATTYRFFMDVKKGRKRAHKLCVNFISFNNKKPIIELIKIQLKSSRAKPATNKTPATSDIFEYVDFRAKTAGNLYGLNIYSVRDKEDSAYIFKDKAVEKGDVIHVPLRDSMSDQSRFNNTADVVVLRWGDDGKLADILPYSDGTYIDWPNDEYKRVINEGKGLGLWTGGDNPADAVDSKKSSTTAPLIKISSGRDKSSWAIENVKESRKVSPKLSNKNQTSKQSVKKKDSTGAKKSNKVSTNATIKDFFKWEVSPKRADGVRLTRVQTLYSGKGGVFKSEYVVLMSDSDCSTKGFLIYAVRSKSADKNIALTDAVIKGKSELLFNLANTKDDDTDILDNNMGIVLLLDGDGRVIDFVAYKRQDANTNYAQKFIKALTFAAKNELWNPAPANSDGESGNLDDFSFFDDIKKNSKKPLERAKNGIGSSCWTLGHD